MAYGMARSGVVVVSCIWMLQNVKPKTKETKEGAG
jgi:hypothetical protein